MSAGTINYQFADGELIGAPPLLVSKDTTQRIALGTIKLGVDQSANGYGEGEFRYVKFTGTVNPGDFVQVDNAAFTAVQASETAGTPNLYGAISIAMAAQVSGSYGWVMIRGIHDGANVVSGVTAGTRLYETTTAGQASGTVVSGCKIDGAFERKVTSSAQNIGTVELVWPVVTGNG